MIDVLCCKECTASVVVAVIKDTCLPRSAERALLCRVVEHSGSQTLRSSCNHSSTGPLLRTNSYTQPPYLYLLCLKSDTSYALRNNVNITCAAGNYKKQNIKKDNNSLKNLFRIIIDCRGRV